MQTTTLRKVGGSVMLAVPPSVLESLGLAAGSEVGLSVEEGRLVMQARSKKKYTLAELLAQCDYSDGLTEEDREWGRAPRAGREVF